MTYGLSLAAQTKNFFVSFGFGFLLGILYDFFFVIRSLISKRKAVTVVCDILFTALATLMSFTLLLVITDGQIRFYALLGEAAGFFVYYLSLGVFVFKTSEKAVLAIRKICRFLSKIFISVFKVISYPFRVIFAFFGKNLKKIRIFLRKILKKSLKKSKYYLRFGNNMLYNQRAYRGILRPNMSKKRKGSKKHSGKRKDKKE